MKEISTTIHDAKTHLSKYIALLEAREIDKVIIKRRDVEVGELRFYQPQKSKRTIGILEGQIAFDEKELTTTAQETTQTIKESIEHMIDTHVSDKK